MSRIALVVARAANGVIGDRGRIPWRLPEDMRRFKELTMGKPCIMGRKTWDSLPKKPLPGRTNIVVTRAADFAAEGAIVVHSLDEAVVQADAAMPDEIAIIGGAGIFGEAVPLARRIHLTEVHAQVEGDVLMPAFDSRQWRETWREDHEGNVPEHIPYSFVTLERR